MSEGPPSVEKSLDNLVDALWEISSDLKKLREATEMSERTKEWKEDEKRRKRSDS